MTIDSLPTYSVLELNEAIGKLIDRGFSNRFILSASILKSQKKKGHLWLTLTDGNASITGVVWSSQLKKIQYVPKEGEGVVIVGKLNFWQLRANLVVQVLNIRPSISTVLRKFEQVRELLDLEGLLDPKTRRPLPKYPKAIAILTSVPSSALADILSIAKERWPMTKLVVVPIPVQGDVADQIQKTLNKLSNKIDSIQIQAIILARGGGSREDLMVFDSEGLCRDLAKFPIPVITGIGHEDDITVADLVADYRASTPTAAVISALPSLEMAKQDCLDMRTRINDNASWILRQKKQYLLTRRNDLKTLSPLKFVEKNKLILSQKTQLLNALSPEHILLRGFSVLRNSNGKTITSIDQISKDQSLIVQLSDGFINTKVEAISSKMGQNIGALKDKS